MGVLLITLCVPNTQAVGEHPPHWELVEVQQQLLVQVIVPKDTEEVQLLMGLLNICVVGPGKISKDMGAQKPEGGDRFHLSSDYNEYM